MREPLVGRRGTLVEMDELERKYCAPVKRIGGYPIPESAKAVILVEIEAKYRREMEREGGD